MLLPLFTRQIAAASEYIFDCLFIICGVEFSFLRATYLDNEDIFLDLYRIVIYNQRSKLKISLKLLLLMFLLMTLQQGHKNAS